MKTIDITQIPQTKKNYESIIAGLEKRTKEKVKRIEEISTLDQKMFNYMYSKINDADKEYIDNIKKEQNQVLQ